MIVAPTPRLLAQSRRLLLETRVLLAERGSWTKGTWARDRYSRPVDPFSPAACRWCLATALLLGEHRLRGTRVAAFDDEALRLVRVPPRRLHTALALLARACFPDSPRTQALPLLNTSLQRETAVLLSTLVAFYNDTQATRHADVLRVLEEAIAAADAERRLAGEQRQGK